jgi:hypothetical protein
MYLLKHSVNLANARYLAFLVVDLQGRLDAAVSQALYWPPVPSSALLGLLVILNDPLEVEFDCFSCFKAGLEFDVEVGKVNWANKHLLCHILESFVGVGREEGVVFVLLHELIILLQPHSEVPDLL